MTELSGAQYTIESGRYVATVASIGASLRTFTVGGRDLVVPFAADEIRPAFRGAILAPWPNRVVDGRYTIDGIEQVLSLTEPVNGHAIHGLAGWLNFTMIEQHADRVVLGATIEAQPGYPTRIELAVEYRLDADGLHSSVTATNSGAMVAPYGTGPHPYLVAGVGQVDDWSLELPASAVLTVTERLAPVAVEPIAAGGGFDFREPRLIAGTFLDHAFTALDRDGTATATVRVLAADGHGVGMSWGEECKWVQVHTADVAKPLPNRIGLAVEPMTCPPDAFNSGTDLILIEPGESSTAAWTIFAI